MMRENIQFKQTVPPSVDAHEKVFVVPESANEPDYRIPDEIIIADDEFAKTPKRLTREDFTEEAILARKFTESAIPTIINEDDSETIVVDDALTKPRLTRADFTQEAIELARQKLNAPYPREENQKNTFPDHELIEMNKRVHSHTSSKTSNNSALTESAPLQNKRLTRADFPGTGSAVMPELVFKKDFPMTQPKKSFLGRFVPKFISRFFGK